jgi:vacuolar-type H+-ATPase subunit I/STV1
MKKYFLLKWAFFYGFLHAFFNLPVSFINMQKDDDYRREFLKGYMEKYN